LVYRVAIVAPQAVPAVVGGAENLWAGLLRSFNQMPGVEAELISPPSPERNLREVLEGYVRFAKLDLSRFNQVVSTKYPAWAAVHHNHTVYLQHTLRGLYDTYPANRLGVDLSDEQIEIASIALSPSLLKALRMAAQSIWAPGQRHRAAEIVFAVNHGGIAQVSQQLLSVTQEFSDQFAAYPGPFARACVRLLDAMCFFIDRPDGAARTFGAISQTVAKRQDYFPQEVMTWVEHHPTSMSIPASDETTAVTRDLIVTASRLEHPKRVDMLMRAYAKSGVRLPFWIIGAGPQQAELTSLAETIPGIEMKGRLTEEELIAAYQRALFVPFAPKNEDYGLITLEAFLSGAAVLTTSDSGGPTELVMHQQSGWISDPTEDSLAQGFRALGNNQESTMSMGRAGQQVSQAITWPRLTQRLLGPNKRKKILVINTFPTEPTTSGGRLRMKGLYSALASYVDIHMVSLGAERTTHHLRRHSPRFVEEIVPANLQFRGKERALTTRVGASCGDIAVSLFPETLPDYLRAVQYALLNVDEVIFAHPYAYPVFEKIIQQHPNLARSVIYEAHNVESYLKGAIYPKGSPELHAVAALEVRLLKNARSVIACSQRDIDVFNKIAASQGVVLKSVLLANNGLDLTNVICADQRARHEAINMTGRRLALFMGSDHGPNHEALEAIIEAASDSVIQNDWDFVVLGSVVKPYKRFRDKHDTVGEPIESIRARAPTVRLLGVVSEDEKSLWLRHATVGLNPMFSGSGTNLKLAEYAAYGLPVLSTAFGARGGAWTAGEHYVEIKDSLTSTLRQFQHMDASLDVITSNAKNLVHERLNWPAIARHLAVSLWSVESPADQSLQAVSAD
jgi:glycosyltransferase involved in cell wall biosynthesis